MQWHKHILVPTHFQQFAVRLANIAMMIALVAMLSMLQSIAVLPDDHQQGQVYKIIYMHVPLAVLSLCCYLLMGICSSVYWIWQVKMADIIAAASAYVGALITVLAIITGAIWAKPTWGAWWVWDARLTSECILMLLYLSYISLRCTLKPRRYAQNMAALIAFLGLIDVPIVHYSVEWWYTLHQGSSLLSDTGTKIAWVMLAPLLVSGVAFASLTAVMLTHTALLLLPSVDKRIAPLAPISGVLTTVGLLLLWALGTGLLAFCDHYVQACYQVVLWTVILYTYCINRLIRSQQPGSENLHELEPV